jgi:hypothetical protein
MHTMHAFDPVDIQVSFIYGEKLTTCFCLEPKQTMHGVYTLFLLEYVYEIPAFFWSGPLTVLGFSVLFIVL